MPKTVLQSSYNNLLNDWYDLTIENKELKEVCLELYQEVDECYSHRLMDFEEKLKEIGVIE